MNVYDCHQKGGTSKGQCALGFGVCCVCMFLEKTVSEWCSSEKPASSPFNWLINFFFFFLSPFSGERSLNWPVTAVVATCNQDVKNNITYFISPNFPTLMSSNLRSCKLKIKMMSSDISQLRFDFVHFSIVSGGVRFFFLVLCFASHFGLHAALLPASKFDFIGYFRFLPPPPLPGRVQQKGQPNRQNGNCDGDVFSLSGGASGDFRLCGYNNGQHSEHMQCQL